MPSFSGVIPLLTYADIAAAHDVLVDAFGFASGGIERTGEGEVIHAEVRLGHATVWLHRVTVAHHLTSPKERDVANGGPNAKRAGRFSVGSIHVSPPLDEESDHAQ